MLPALNESFFLKFIQERHKAARKNCKALPEFLLTKPWRLGDKPKYAGVGATQPQAGEPFAKLTRSVCSDLRQQKRSRTSAPRL